MTATHAMRVFGRWQTLSLMEQMGNIGSEVERAFVEYALGTNIFGAAATRALELFDATVRDPRCRRRLKEILRSREVFCDALTGGNEYGSVFADVNAYFLEFAIAARCNR